MSDPDWTTGPVDSGAYPGSMTSLLLKPYGVGSAAGRMIASIARTAATIRLPRLTAAMPAGHRDASRRQQAIDLLRGLTALFVSTDHFLRRIHGSTFPRAHLAVELFFVMSGFVLTQQAIARRHNRPSTFRFVIDRIGRLYPIYALGLVLGSLELIVAKSGNGTDWVTPISASAIVANFLFLPELSTAGPLFPINGPMWTLPLEIGLNAFLFHLIRLRAAYLLLLIMLSGVAVAVIACRAGTLNLGWSWGMVIGGWARGAFAFAAGIFLARENRLRLTSAWWLIPAVSGFAMLTVCPSPVRWELAIEIAGAILVVPSLFLLASNVRLPDRTASSTRLLAKMSYPMFCLHTGIIRPVIVLGHVLHMADRVLATIYLLLCLGVSYAVTQAPLLAPRIRRRLVLPRDTA